MYLESMMFELDLKECICFGQVDLGERAFQIMGKGKGWGSVGGRMHVKEGVGKELSLRLGRPLW